MRNEPRKLRRLPADLGRPALRMETGFDKGVGAPVLLVYHPPDGNTYVVPDGDVPPSSGWGYKGFQRPDVVLAWYVLAQSVRRR